jgi:hypothetical protein
MRTSHVVAALALVMSTGALAGPAVGQSLTSVSGPGYPVLPADARTAALGGIGLGLHGLAAPMTNPAAFAQVTRRGAVVALEATDRTIRFGDMEDEVGTARFPLVRLVFPVRRAVLTAGYGGYLDQSWGLVREGEQPLGTTTATFREVMRSEGGVGQFQVGAAVPLRPNLAVGAALGLHTGSQRVTYERGFDVPEEVLTPHRETLAWRYRGPLAQAGVRWEPTMIIRLGASVTWAGTLVGEPTEGRAERRELDLPLQLAGGASAVLVPGLIATLGGRWSGWSVTDPDAIGVPAADAPRSARDTWEVGGGLEWGPVGQLGRRSYPLRAGFQYRQLPFPFADEPPSEFFVGGGIGLRMGPDPENPLGSVDLTVQRGTRTATGAGAVDDLTERMWRMILSVSLFGN